MLVRRALAVPGFNPDDVAIDTASGMTLLMWAATSGQDEIVRLLLRRGAGVNTVQKRTAMTALLHAAEQVHINGNSPWATHSDSSDNERKLLFTHSCSDQDFDRHWLSVEIIKKGIDHALFCCKADV